MSRKIVLPQTENEKTLLGISDEAWSMYNDMFIPIEDMWLDAIRPPSQSDYQSSAGRWTAETAGVFGAQERQDRQGMFAGRITPGSGLFLSNLSSGAANKGAAATAAVNEGLNATDMDYYQKAVLAGRFGQGAAQESVGGLYSGAAAEATARRIGEASRAYANLAAAQNQAGWMNVAGTAAGVGLGYLSTRIGSNPGDVVVQTPGGTSYNYNLNAPTGVGH